MEVSLDPTMAFEGLPLGASKADVRTFFRRQPSPFHRTPTSNEADYWPELGVFAYYDDDERLVGVELAEKASPTVGGKVITSLTLQAAKKHLRRLDPDVELENDGATSRRLGISIWSEAGEREPVQSVMCFASGYYD